MRSREFLISLRIAETTDGAMTFASSRGRTTSARSSAATRMSAVAVSSRSGLPIYC
ncbi:hypothetical protein RFM41_20865 [Mesorhizobium sp. VK25A]|nr:hypothetical protein [Mesorhizobium sp. VK25A]